MIETLKQWDTQILLFFNQFHTPELDNVMLLVTKTEFWAPLYMFLIYLVFKNYKNEGWIILLGVGITVLLADQFTSSFMKPFFHRLRPSHEPLLDGIVHLATEGNGSIYRGGSFGFASSHAANTLGVAFFLFQLFKDQYKWIWLVFLWTITMCYSRIYLGVHYPADIFVGGIVGLISGYLGFKCYRWSKEKFMKSKEVG